MWRTLVAVLVVVSGAGGQEESVVHSEDFFELINEAQDSWKAGRNFLPGSAIKNLYSALPPQEEQLPLQKLTVVKTLPGSFDGRKVWKKCKFVRAIKDQGNCASAWALVAGGIFTDRLCIAGIDTAEISSQQVMSCCTECGVNCFGGFLTEALKFIVKKGVPTTRCQPYGIRKCPVASGSSQGLMNCPSARSISPLCWGYCRYTASHRRSKDTRRASGAYSLSNSTDAIMGEIMSRGPVAAVMDLYEDFFVYKKGVYLHTAGRLVGQHPVKVVGWGVEGGKPYWLVLNTWGSLWGDKGVVKIARGTNECNLENRVYALTPKE